MMKYCLLLCVVELLLYPILAAPAQDQLAVRDLRCEYQADP